MPYFKTPILFLIAALIALGSVNNATAEFEHDSSLLGIKVGALFPGGVTVSSGKSRDFDVHSGTTLGLLWDFPVFNYFYLGPFVDYSMFTAADDDGITKFDVGLALKFKFSLSDNLVLRPAVSLAYGHANITPDPGINNYVTEESNDFFVYQAFIEAIYNSIVVDFGYAEAEGGNEEDVYFYGQTFLRVGYLF